MSKNSFTSVKPGRTATQPQQIFAALVLSSILSFGTSATLLQAANAAPQLAQSAASETIQGKADDHSLPPQLANAVRQDLSRQLGIAPEELRIIESSRKTWSNGCLELPRPGEFCTSVLVAGWRIVVSNGSRNWVYHTDNRGRVVRLENQTASSKLPKDEKAKEIGDLGTLKPTQIPQGELPPALSEGVIFRAIASGGITGQTYQITLLNDGRVLRVLVNPNNTQASGTEIRQISPQQIQHFQQLLECKKFSRFNRLSYQALNGAADFMTITLSSPAGTTKYADLVQSSLPKALQEVIQAWNQIAKRA